LAPGRHVFASLPGGLRRSAKTRSFTAVLVYRRAVGDGWAGGTNPLRASDLVLRPSHPLRLGGMANVFGTGATRFRIATGRLTPLR
jgi:hypothetical protein